MNILYTITKSTIGGAQTHVFQLARFFSQRGNNVALMAKPGDWLEAKIKEEGITFYPNNYFSNFPNPFNFKARRRIKKVVKEFQPDLISCHSTAAGFLTRITIKNKIPTIFTAHGWSFAPGVPWLKKLSAFLVEKITARFSKKIICVSNFDRNLALKYRIVPENKLEVIHNGVEIKNYPSDKSFQYPLKIVFVGRYSQQKDPLLLLKAFSELNIKDKTELTFIGGGEKEEAMNDFIKKNNLKVDILSSLPRKRVMNILRNSHIFVLTTNWEGLPRSILEAMSLGLPVIASDVGGVGEIVKDNCGILIGRGDKEGVKNALEKLVNNRDLLKKMSKNSRKRIEKEFSLEKMFSQTEKIYEEIR